MAVEPLGLVQASFGQLLAEVGAYHAHLQRELNRPDLDAAGRERICDALGYATELVEILESVAFDRIRCLAVLQASA
jgi:hypothetical protein